MTQRAERTADARAARGVPSRASPGGGPAPLQTLASGRGNQWLARRIGPGAPIGSFTREIKPNTFWQITQYARNTYGVRGPEPEPLAAGAGATAGPVVPPGVAQNPGTGPPGPPPAKAGGPLKRNRNVAETDDTFERYPPEQGAAAAPVDLSANPYKGGKDYDFGYWFNYFYQEVPIAQRKSFWDWAAANPAPTDEDQMLAQLTAMLSLGMEFAQPVKLAQAHEGPASVGKKDHKDTTVGRTETDYTQPRLQSIKHTGLGFRVDARPMKLIREHQGFHAALRQPNGDEFRRGRNLDKRWHPFANDVRRQALYLRRENQDNDLQSLVSVAVDPRDAVRFPLPGSEKAGGGRHEGPRDRVNLYVVYLGPPQDAEVVNTTGWAVRRGATEFGRGEIGVSGIPLDQVLMHADVERQYDGKSKGYVVGEVKSVTRMISFEALPKVTSLAAEALERELTSGGLRFLENGMPDVGNKVHEELQRHLRLKRAAAAGAMATASGAAAGAEAADRGASAGAQSAERGAAAGAQSARAAADAIAERIRAMKL